MNKFFILILFTSTSSLHSMAAEKCEAILAKEGSCESLSAQKELTFSDGTVLKNPLFKDRNSSATPRSESEIAEADEALLEAKVEFLHLMESKKEKLSPRFRAQLIAQGDWALSCLFTESDDLNDEVGFNDQIPWPATESKAPLRRVMPKELKSFLKTQFSSQELKSVEEKYKKSKAPNGEAMKNAPLSSMVDGSGISKKKAEEKITRLFKTAKDSILQKILKGRSVNQLSEAEKSMFDRVNTVRLDLSPDAQSECTRVPNAEYRPISHQFTLCPSFYDYPESTLIGVIAHEIGHSIDLCQSQLPLIRVDENSIFDSSKAMSGDDGEIELALTQLRKYTDNGPYSIPDFPLSFANYKDTYQKLKSDYKIEEAAPGVLPNRNPFKKVNECLINQGFRSSSMDKIEPDLIEYYRELPKKERLAAVKKDMALLQKYPECIDLQKRGELNEAFSDYLASEVLADYFEKNKPKSKSDILAPALVLLNIECSKPVFIGIDSSAFGGGILGVAARVRAGIEGRFNDPHPPSLERARKITYASPRLAKALGCAPGEAKECFDPKLVPPQATGSGSSSARKGTK